MNEIKQHRIAKQYKDYYKYYTASLYKKVEQEVSTVQGTVTWVEGDIEYVPYSKQVSNK